MIQVLVRGTPLIDGPTNLDPDQTVPFEPSDSAPGCAPEAALNAALNVEQDPEQDPERGLERRPVTAVGVDETAFLAATGTPPTLFATGITDLTPGRPARLLDVVQGRSGRVLGDWLATQDPHWRARVRTVKLGLAAVDDVRRRVQQDQTGHRGRAGDPLYGIRRLLRRRHDRRSERAYDRLIAGLAAGDPNGEVVLAWVIAQDLMAVDQASDLDQGRRRSGRLITGLRGCPVPELARLGGTLHSWRSELLAHFDHPAVSNGPTENLNLKIKHTKRIARGYRNFGHYRPRLLLNHGRHGEDHRTPQTRTRRPRLAA